MTARALTQWFPTGGSRTPGVRNKILVVRSAILQGGSLYVLWSVFFQKNRDLWKLVSAILKWTLSSLIIPGNVANLSI